MINTDSIKTEKETDGSVDEKENNATDSGYTACGGVWNPSTSSTVPSQTLPTESGVTGGRTSVVQSTGPKESFLVKQMKKKSRDSLTRWSRPFRASPLRLQIPSSISSSPSEDGEDSSMYRVSTRQRPVGSTVERSAATRRTSLPHLEGEVLAKARAGRNAVPPDTANHSFLGPQNLSHQPDSSLPNRHSTVVHAPSAVWNSSSSPHIDAGSSSSSSFGTPPSLDTEQAPRRENMTFTFIPPENAAAEEDELGGIPAFVPGRRGIVEATEVTIIPSEEEELAIQRRKYIRWIIVFSCIIAAVVVAIVVPVTMRLTTNDGSEDVSSIETNPTIAPTTASPSTPAPTSQHFSEVVEAVMNISGGERLNDSTSPAYKAANWIADDGRANDDPRFLQRYAMAVFYFATKGDEWDDCSRNDFCKLDGASWLSESHECDWFMVSCENHFVTKIYNTIGNNLQGTLPQELGLLTTLKMFTVQNNVGLGGTIPPELGNLANITFLALSWNSLEGTIPSKLFDSSKQLNTVYFRSNLLNGTIPYGLAQLRFLIDLELDGNDFTGTIHSEFGSLPNLKVLDLFENRLNGTIPKELFGALNLEKLHLDINSVSGTLAPSIRNGSKLTSFTVSSNMMTGVIPSELYQVTTIKELDLSDNMLSGPLSNEIGALVNLEQLYLNNNSFTGTVPAVLGTSAPSLNVLSLHGNNFTGSIAEEICNATGTGSTEIVNLTADCAEVQCSCCSRCY